MFNNREQLQEILKSESTCTEASQRIGCFYLLYKNNKRVREDAEGNKFEITFDADGKRQEFEYHE